MPSAPFWIMLGSAWTMTVDRAIDGKLAPAAIYACLGLFWFAMAKWGCKLFRRGI